MLLSPAVLVLITAAALLVVGWAVAGRLWRGSPGERPEGLEELAAATTIAFTLWIALDWLLLLTGTFHASLLYGRTALAVVVAAVVIVRNRSRFASQVRLTPAAYGLIVALGLWSVFILWRGAILPPLTHDVLSHHLPRAVLYVRAAAFVDLSKVSSVFLDIPVNYEVLLADIVAMMRNDDFTEWLSTVQYLLFVGAAGALSQRWWRDSRIDVAVMTFAAGMPIVLLHSGAHKNDLMVGLFMLLALVWAGRYLMTGETQSLLLLGASVLLAAGTKPQGGILGAVLLPLVLVRAVRDLRARRLRVAAAIGIAAAALLGILLLGCFVYVDNHLPSTAPAAPSAPTGTSVMIQGYNDWANVWQAPWVLVAAPLSMTPNSLPVPWDRPWFWKRYEIYFSHLGVPFVLCFVAAPFAIKGWRGDGARERLAIGAATLATTLLMLPVRSHPHGMYLISLPRYLLFFAVVVLIWSVGGLVRALERVGPRVLALVSVAALGFFAVYAVDMAVSDTFAPLDYVLIARDFPGTRYIPFDPYRASSIVDSVAGPDDVIAVDARWGSWIYPLYGPGLTRRVRFIAENGPVTIGDDVDWVVVERAYETIWGSAKMSSLGTARKYFGTALPDQDGLRLVRALIRDPRFELVHAEPRRNQFVFRRRARPQPR